jgi:hypothetical protein
MREPFVAVIVRLGPQTSQVVVAREHGASRVRVSLYGIVRGRLKLLRFPPPFPDKLSLFGSVGTGSSNARCRQGGPLIVLHESPRNRTGTSWRFDRTEYRLAGDQFVVTRRRTAVVSRAQAGMVSQRWGLSGMPFTGCAIARGRRL